MTGMTGNVPYFGGRFTPAQAYAASHPSPPPTPPRAALPPSAAPPPRTARPRPDPQEALDHLLETGVIDQQEYDQLRARVAR